MPASKAQRAANKKWGRDNRRTVSCTMRSAEVETFIEIANTNGTTVNALIREWIRDYIEKNGIANHNQM